MTLSRRQFLHTVGFGAAYAALPALLGGCAASAAAKLASNDEMQPAPQMSDNAAMLHLLNRITYGPRPGELAQATALGYEAFLEQQLHPEQIDDSALDARLTAFSTLAMSNAQLLAGYLQNEKQKKDRATATVPLANDTAQSGGNLKPAQIIGELQQAALLRAIASERQLFEIMVDFWSNHLNIDIHKQNARLFKTGDDRNVIRAHALGTFRDLLLASAKSPAMLVYLDNAENIASGSRGGNGGLNENYAREVMELHTVGVDGGYTQADITTVARTLTGWGIAGPKTANPSTFLFTPRLHDRDAKQIAFLGLDLPAGGGITEGEQLLAKLAAHPKTAARIARKLCVAFVADDPPQALVDRAAQAYLNSDTDIRATLGLILRSAEFKASAGQKVKLPVRALVSMVRASGASVEDPQILSNTLKTMGQPFFSWQSPNGYPQVGAAWVNTSGLLSRWNAAFNLTEGRTRGTKLDLAALAGGAAKGATMVDTTYQAIFNTAPSATTRATLVEFVGSQQQPLPALVGLLLAAPEFQMY